MVSHPVNEAGDDGTTAVQVRLDKPRRDRLLKRRSGRDDRRCLRDVPHSLPCDLNLVQFYETLKSQVAYLTSDENRHWILRATSVSQHHAPGVRVRASEY